MMEFRTYSRIYYTQVHFKSNGYAFLNYKTFEACETMA